MTAPRWEDSGQGDLLELVAMGSPSTGSADAEWRAFEYHLRDAASRTGRISPNYFRYLVRGQEQRAPVQGLPLDRRQAVRAWWHRLRYADCGICGREFRKGKGGGVSRRVLCSERCFKQAWLDWLRDEARYKRDLRDAITGAAS